MANLYFIVPILLLAFIVQDGEPVRCFVCSSELEPRCHDPIIENTINNSDGYRFVNCDAQTGATYPYLTSSKSACMKMIKTINGQKVTMRRCTWKREDDNTTNCSMLNSGSSYNVLFCETCQYDGCNSV